MRRARSPFTILLALLALSGALFVAGCGDDDDDSGSDESSAAPSDLSDCTPDKLETQKAGTLTVATDSPAFPPYFVDDDPTNGQGFESAVAYAIADQLGFEQADVEWVVEPFNSSYAPGAEGLRLRRQPDLDHAAARGAGRLLLALLRGEAGDRRAQGLRRRQRDLARRPRGRRDRRPDRDHQPRGGQRRDPARQRPAGLRHLQRRRHGAQAGRGRRGRRRRADGFFLTAVQVPEADRRRPVRRPGRRRVGRLLEKDSPLTACVSFAIDELKDSGELGEIENEWISEKTDAPVLE